jgi:hypothetical protein
MTKGKSPPGEYIEDYKDQPKDCENGKVSGYPATGVKTSGWPRRGVNAQTKAKTARGPKC